MKVTIADLTPTERYRVLEEMSLALREDILAGCLDNFSIQAAAYGLWAVRYMCSHHGHDEHGTLKAIWPPDPGYAYQFARLAARCGRQAV